MPVKLNKVCSDVEVEDEKHVVFPPEIVGSIRPGSLDYLTKTQIIEWGENMVDKIEHGTLPFCCMWLLLPANYKHPTDDLKFRSDGFLYVHHTNIEHGFAVREFFIWKGLTDPKPALPPGLKHAGNSTWYESDVFKTISILKVKKVQQSTAVSVEALGKKHNDYKASMISIKHFDAKLEVIRDIMDSHRTDAESFEAKVAAELASIKSSIADLTIQIGVIAKHVAPRPYHSPWGHTQ